MSWLEPDGSSTLHVSEHGYPQPLGWRKVSCRQIDGFIFGGGKNQNPVEVIHVSSVLGERIIDDHRTALWPRSRRPFGAHRRRRSR